MSAASPIISEPQRLEKGAGTDVDFEPQSIEGSDQQPKRSSRKPLRFWLIFLSLLLPAFAANLNATILSTVMPLIVRDVRAEVRYIWINASYAIACAAIQPLLGQISNIYGRRYPMLISLLFFTLGSGISGGATSVDMLVAGRTVQGLGGGGIMMLLEVILCDLLPQRERPKYLGIILSVMSLGVLLGPSIGGAFAKNASWHWAFYVSVPIGGVGFLTSVPLLRFKALANSSGKKALARIDVVGNAIFIASTCSMLVGLIMGGAIYPWSSFRVILPIVLGVLGWVSFGFHQASSFVAEPTMPPRIFSNRTALTGYILVLISGILLEWIVYYLPYYFQTLKGSSPLSSSAQVLPFNVFLIPSAAINGLVMAKTGRYKYIHVTGFVFLSLGTGLFSTMGASTSTVKWVFWQLFASYGLGSLINSTLPAIQSSLPEEDVAASTATHAFLRSIGFIWGFTIPSLVFNGRIRSYVSSIDEPAVREAISTEDAYSAGGGKLIASLSGKVKHQVEHIYAISLRDVWYTAMALSIVGFLFVFLEKNLQLREDLQETQFGLEEKKQTV